MIAGTTDFTFEVCDRQQKIGKPKLRENLSVLLRENSDNRQMLFFIASSTIYVKYIFVSQHKSRRKVVSPVLIFSSCSDFRISGTQFSAILEKFVLIYVHVWLDREFMHENHVR